MVMVTAMATVTVMDMVMVTDTAGTAMVAVMDTKRIKRKEKTTRRETAEGSEEKTVRNRRQA